MSAQPNGNNSLKTSSVIELIILVAFMAALTVVGFFVGQLVGQTGFATMSQASGGLAITSTLLKSMGYGTAAQIYNGTAAQAFGQANTAISTDEMAFAAMFGLFGALLGIVSFARKHESS